MVLLDAALALVVTLAALATSVTVLMEIWVRFSGLKSKTQIELFSKIFDDAVYKKFPGELSKKDILRKVLSNPLHDFATKSGWTKAAGTADTVADRHEVSPQPELGQGKVHRNEPMHDGYGVPEY